MNKMKIDKYCIFQNNTHEWDEDREHSKVEGDKEKKGYLQVIALSIRGKIYDHGLEWRLRYRHFLQLIIARERGLHGV